ncbi:putative bifunctional diguanylate cyclase/phosphodiesterase [Rhodococcoides kyotonense]|uniref:Diguanylate cyclase (GGDEF) domain-containing protein n=1 Tax=Rhodococcoides kyotonense TaxID=398843 RepID=A0A239LHA7_9NOCA|nr:EAL domain-containing protein [Rhodococcus kyotonensis]SNT29059.1 diguanylate cyclase (GGDEF) domain-containing protein [Rhodococcus kyotonensis]
MPDPTEDPVILRALLENSPDFVSLSEFSGRVVFVNEAGLGLIGRAALPEEPFLTTADFFTQQGLDVAPEVEDGLSTIGFWQGMSELRHHVSGAGIPVAITTFVIRRDGDKPDLIASIIRDRTEGVRRDRQLEESVVEARRSAAEKHALADLSRLAVSGELPELLDAAAAAASMLIGVESAAIARHAHPSDTFLRIDAVTRTMGDSPVVPAGDKSLAGYAIAHNSAIVCTDVGRENRFDTSAMKALGLHSGMAVPVPISSPDPWGALSVYSAESRDYSDQEIEFLTAVTSVLSTALKRIDLDRELRRRSMHDALTGLPNRTLAYEIIDDALARAKDESGSVALLLLDIDDFKIINDSLGHDAGDRALVRFSHRLAGSVRPEDTVARLGGDEFLIICERIDDAKHAEALARRITTSIAAPVSTAEAPVPLSGSIGIAVSEPTSTRRQLVHQADLAMYRAKDSGGGYAVFDTGDLYDADRVRSLSIDLRNALTRGELTLAYQPLVQITTGKIVAVEALARWQHPMHGLVDPSEFVAVAERTGLATALGSWALRTACSQAAKWRSFSDIEIRVNVSALQLRNPMFPDEVAIVLKETNLPPQALGLEITETVWVADTARVADTLTALHTMGVSLLLDDLGKGHSSISYLDRYPMFECFKIDKSFIGALPAPRAIAVVTAIVSLAKAFKVTVVGEGVETQDQLDALAATGCDIAQGYLFGRPMVADDLTALLA